MEPLVTGVHFQVAALYYISEPAPTSLSSTTSIPNTASQTQDASRSFGADADAAHEPIMDEARKQELRSLAIQELLQSSKFTAPPHPISHHGEYSGWVWTIPESRYDKTEALPNWPPATEGPKAAAIKWFASLKAGSIFLARPTTLEDSDVVPVGEIPLSGCTVRLVTGGVAGKTRWWRKTPLEISHPSRALFARQKTFLLFCDGSAAKEQWFTAVTWACSGGGPPQAVEELYSTFCTALRDNKKLNFPQVLLSYLRPRPPTSCRPSKAHRIYCGLVAFALPACSHETWYLANLQHQHGRADRHLPHILFKVKTQTTR